MCVCVCVVCVCVCVCVAQAPQSFFNLNNFLLIFLSILVIPSSLARQALACVCVCARTRACQEWVK